MLENLKKKVREHVGKYYNLKPEYYEKMENGKYSLIVNRKTEDEMWEELDKIIEEEWKS